MYIEEIQHRIARNSFLTKKVVETNLTFTVPKFQKRNLLDSQKMNVKIESAQKTKEYLEFFKEKHEMSKMTHWVFFFRTALKFLQFGNQKYLNLA